MVKKTRIWLGIGTNMGDRLANIYSAVKELNAKKIEVVRTSSIYETSPVGFESDSQFLNAVLECETALDAEQVLDIISEVEQSMGRIRSTTERYTSRIIDLDILLFADQIIATQKLEVPHPRLCERRFVLEPLAELIGGEIHPVKEQTISQLLSNCSDQNGVKIYRNPLVFRQ